MTDIARLDWEDLKIAAALAHAGTYAGAADELGVDATTVARRIARLEKSFAAPLFHAVDGLQTGNMSRAGVGACADDADADGLVGQGVLLGFWGGRVLG